MKLKIIAAMAGIAIVSILLLAATASAFMASQNNNGNSATSGTYQWGPFEFGDDGVEGFREGGMMRGWGPFAQNNNGTTNAFGDDWGWHE